MTENGTRRMYTADWLDLIRDLQSRAPSEPSASVEITRNAKGDPQFTVKVYAPHSAELEEIERATSYAYDQAVQAFDALGAKFPPPAKVEK